MPKKIYVLVEGHGEVLAVGNLLSRLVAQRGLALRFSKPLRWKNLHTTKGLERGAEFVRSKPDAEGLLVLRDEDDLCPRDVGPLLGGRLLELDLGFPSAAVVFHPEYEVLFLPCLSHMQGPLPDGRPGLVAGTIWPNQSWEHHRGVKEWLTKHFPPGKSYKPTLDQLPLTRKIDLEVLTASQVPCFGTLTRALEFLDTSNQGSYPS